LNLTWFCFENDLVLQYRRNDTNLSKLYDFDDFVVVGRGNAHVYPTTLICDLSVYIVEALEFVYLVLVQLFQLFSSCKMRNELCRNGSLKPITL